MAIVCDSKARTVQLFIDTAHNTVQFNGGTYFDNQKHQVADDKSKSQYFDGYTDDCIYNVTEHVQIFASSIVFGSSSASTRVCGTDNRHGIQHNEDVFTVDRVTGRGLYRSSENGNQIETAYQCHKFTGNKF